MTGESRPLDGATVVVTRPAGQGEVLAGTLAELGAQVILLPLLAIAPPVDWSAADRAIQRISEFDWIVFTSANGVRGLIDRLSLTSDATFSSTARFAAVGPATRQCAESLGLHVSVMPSEFNAVALAARCGPRSPVSACYWPWVKIASRFCSAGWRIWPKSHRFRLTGKLT